MRGNAGGGTLFVSFVPLICAPANVPSSPRSSLAVPPTLSRRELQSAISRVVFVLVQTDFLGVVTVGSLF